MLKGFEDSVRHIILEGIDVKKAVLENNIPDIVKATDMIVKSLKNGNKTLFFGNGGSAADAQHLAAEFVNRFLKDRPALPGIALTTDTSVLTSISNDQDYSFIFSRQIEALGREGDVALGISTSGKSLNVVKGIKKAREKGLSTIALVGGKSEGLTELADIVISVLSSNTPRIQEAHIMIGHIICQLVEAMIYPEG